MQRVTALLRSSCSASIAGNIRWLVFGGVTAGGFQRPSSELLHCCPRGEEREECSVGSVEEGGSERRGGSILRGLTACCTCPPPIIMQLTLRRTALHPRAGFVHKFWNEAETMQRHNPSHYTPKNCDLCRHMFCWEETDSSLHQSIKPKQKHRPGVTPR